MVSRGAPSGADAAAAPKDGDVAEEGGWGGLPPGPSPGRALPPRSAMRPSSKQRAGLDRAADEAAV